MKELTWDLTELYKTHQQVDDDLKIIVGLANNIKATKKSLNSKEGLLNYLKLSEQFSKLMDKLECYLFLSKSLDGSDVYVIEKLSELENFYEKFSDDTTFVMQELKKISSNDLMQWSKLPEFKNYDNFLMDIIKVKKHTLSEKEEKIMSAASFTTCQSEIFDNLDNVELKFGKITDENGNRVELTNANYSKYAKSTNKNVRKSAVKNMLSAYKAVNQTLSTNYLSYVKYKNFVAKTYKYKNTLDMCLQNEDLPNGIPQAVVKNVTEHLTSLHDYYLWRKNFMQLPKFESCDIGCDLFDKSIAKEYTLSEGIDLIKKALSPLGKDYTDMLDYAAKNNWIDSKERPNKDSGAYQLGLYGYHPYILLSYNQSFSSVNTLAHEFGHAMNSYYSENSQPYSKHSNCIFLAEIASTVNEILLSDYNIRHAKTSQEKINYITKFLNNFIGSVFVQTQYTEFELFAHDCIDKGEPLSYKKLNDFYCLLNKKYLGKHVILMPERNYHWSVVPHFYSAFYVYKYVTGFISACAIAQKILADKSYVETYKQFLGLGSSKKPCDALKLAGVDILSKTAYDNAFKIFDSYLQELKNL